MQRVKSKIMNELDVYRIEIDALDRELIDVLARRFAVVRKVGHYKIKNHMEAIQPERAAAVKTRAIKMGDNAGLDSAFVQKIYDALIDYAHDLEHDIMGEKP